VGETQHFVAQDFARIAAISQQRCLGYANIVDWMRRKKNVEKDRSNQASVAVFEGCDPD